MAAVAALLLLASGAGQAKAASRPLEAYNPKTDPNYAQGASQNAPVDWQAIWGLVREFEMQPLLTADRRQGVGLPTPYQSGLSANASDASAPSRLVPGGLVYQSLYGFPAYADGGWYPRRWDPSPRIPWWSLTPFAEQSRDRHGDH